MTITFRYRHNGLLKLETVTLKHVRSIVETGVREYAITCYGNDAVTWRGVSQIKIASESERTIQQQCYQCGSLKPIGQSCGCFDNNSQ